MATSKVMEPETIERNTTKIQSWLDAHPNLADDDEYVDSVELIELCLRRMIRNPDKAVKNWSQICTEGRDFPLELEWPIKQGKESNLPTFVRTSVAHHANNAYEEALDYAENSTILERTFVNTKNEEIGGLCYADLENGAELYAKGQKTSTSQRFTKLFNDKRWNGMIVDEAVYYQPQANANSSGEEE